MDLSLFYWLHHLEWKWLDTLSLWISGPYSLKFIVVFSLVYVVVARDRKAFVTILMLFIAVGIADGFSYYGIRDIVQRLRPCHIEPNLRLLEACGARYGFPSNHAINAAAAVTVIWLRHPGKKNWLFAGIAVLIGISRVHLGFHYPTDILGGFFLGAAVAGIVHLTSLAFKARNWIPVTL